MGGANGKQAENSREFQRMLNFAVKTGCAVANLRRKKKSPEEVIPELRP